MTAKEYLRQVKTARDAKNRLLNEAQALMDQATKITSSISPARAGGGDGRKIENAAIRLADLSAEFSAQAMAYADIEREVMDTINSIPEPYATLLYLRYFEGMTWEHLAVKMNYSWRHVHRVHAEALAIIDGIVCQY